jgi:hypothetical protein
MEDRKIELTVVVEHADLKRDENDNLVAHLVGISEKELLAAIERYRALLDEQEANKQAKAGQ